MRIFIAAIILTLIFLVVPFKSFVLTYSEEITEDYLIKAELEAIFEHRAKIWNRFVLGEYEAIGQLEIDLMQNTVDPLLSTDLEIFTQLKNNPTSYELIDGVNITKFEIEDISKYYTIAYAEIEWTMQDGNQSYIESIEYTIYLLKAYDKWMISDYVVK